MRAQAVVERARAVVGRGSERGCAFFAQEAVTVAGSADCPGHWVGLTDFLSPEEATVALLAGAFSTGVARGVCELLVRGSILCPPKSDCCSQTAVSPSGFDVGASPPFIVHLLGSGH